MPHTAVQPNQTLQAGIRLRSGCRSSKSNSSASGDTVAHMVDSADKLEQAELRLTKAQEALDDVGKVLEAAEKAQAAADRARESAEHAHATLRKMRVVVPVVALIVVVLLSGRRRSRSTVTGEAD